MSSEKIISVKKFVSYLYCLLFILFNSPLSNEINVKESCSTCQELVQKFYQGMDKTAKNHFGGGDTAWEESRLGNYARSETRLLEILENVCKGASKDSACHAMVEEHEEEIESFWFKKQNQLSQLENHLCISIAKVCCPSGKYGETCKECPGGANSPCFGRGKCNGNGTRSGNGKCKCDTQFSGEFCDECSDGYYDAGNLTCEECHESCDSTCSSGTSAGCDSCKDGYIDNSDGKGCVDIDECIDETHKHDCVEGKFCINEKGSFRCNECDPACLQGCVGTGRLSCNGCNPGWEQMATGGCVDIDECIDENICETGTYCVNNEGSHICEQCNLACAGGCTDGTPNTCVECDAGFTLTDEGCVDVDECKEKNITCPIGQVCVNRPGSDLCESCHTDCNSCVSTEANGCLVCKSGFTFGQNGCEDVDECKLKPCKIKGEKCHNSPGSYSCKCKKGWVRTKQNDCKKKSESKKLKKEEDKNEL